MSQETASIRRRGWAGALLWALLVMTSAVLVGLGLWLSFFPTGYHPLPDFEEDLRLGSLYIFAGSVASLAAAAWSFRRGHPHWVTALVAAPAIMVGGVALMSPTSGLRQILALIALPAAMAGITGGLLDRGYRRVT